MLRNPSRFYGWSFIVRRRGANVRRQLSTFFCHAFLLRLGCAFRAIIATVFFYTCSIKVLQVGEDEAVAVIISEAISVFPVNDNLSGEIEHFGKMASDVPGERGDACAFVL